MEKEKQVGTENERALAPVAAQDHGAMILARMSDAQFQQGLDMLDRGEHLIRRLFERSLTRGDTEDADLMEMAGMKSFLTQNGAVKVRHLLGLVTNVQPPVVTWGDGVTQPVVTVAVQVEFRKGAEHFGTYPGYATSWEPKYRYIDAKPKCPECAGMLRPSKDRPEWYCWRAKGGCGATFPRDQFRDLGKVENPDQGAALQTLCVMAAKRATVLGTRLISGVSRYTTQDEETFEDNAPKGTPVEEAPAAQAAPARAPAAPAISDELIAEAKALLASTWSDGQLMLSDVGAAAWRKRFKAAKSEAVLISVMKNLKREISNQRQQAAMKAANAPAPAPSRAAASPTGSTAKKEEFDDLPF